MDGWRAGREDVFFHGYNLKQENSPKNERTSRILSADEFCVMNFNRYLTVLGLYQG